MENTIRHFDYLDFAKGIGIILVIMGHTIFPVHEAISIFHMPLFFFLAGITLKIYPDFELFLLRKTDRIFIPYLFFSFLSFITARIVGYEGSIFNGPLWFLQSLFGALIISELVLKSEKLNKWSWAFLLAFVTYTYISSHSKYPFFPFDTDFDIMIRSSVYVLAGYYLKDFVFTYSIRDTKLNSALVFIIMSIFFAVLCYVSIFKLGAGGGWLYGEILRYNILLFYLTSLAGIFTVISFCKTFESSKAIKPFIWLGRNSLVIMCVHYPFLQWWNQLMSSWDFYANGDYMQKALIALLSYSIAIAFSLPFVFLSKRVFPHLTGYKSILSK